MLKHSRPLLLLVATLSIMLIALAGFWLAYLPRLIVGNIKQAAVEQGLQFSSSAVKLSFSESPALEFVDVTLAATGADGAGFLTAKSARVNLTLRHIFGLSTALDEVALDAPILDLNIQTLKMPVVLGGTKIIFQDGVVKFRDPVLQATVLLREMNGSITTTTNGAARLSASGLLNDVLTDFAIDVEDAARIGTSGSPVDVSVNTRTVAMGFAGRLKALGAVQFDGRMSVDAADVRDATQLLGVALKSLTDSQQLHVDAGVSTTGARADFNVEPLKIGAALFAGKVTVAAGADRMKLNGNLTVDQLAFLAKPETLPSLARPWSERTLPLTDLLALDADLTLTSQQTALGNLKLGPGKTKLNIQEGSMTLAFEGASGGTQFNMELAHGADATALRLKGSGKAMDAQQLFGEGLGVPNIAGLLDIEFVLKAAGTSIAAAISTLAGSIGLTADAAALPGIDAKETLLVPGTGWRVAANRSTQPVKLNLNFKLSEGIATVDQAEISASGVQLKASGEIDLLRQTLAIKLSPKLWLKGKWSNPNVEAGN